MSKTYILSILFVLFSTNLSISQSILQSAFVTTGIVNLGNTAQVQIILDQITICDTYTTTTDINHFSKIIDVKVNYNYISNCSDAFGSITIIEDFLPLLEGIYTVNVNISVPADITRGEIRAIGAITTNPPFYPDCALSFGSPQICPVNSLAVCGENGKTYNNECESYFNAQIANYQRGNCPSIAAPFIQPFECNRIYTQGNVNNFTSYNCFNFGCFDQNEILLRYNHNISGGLNLKYTKTDLSEVMLAVFDGFNNIECIATGDNEHLEISNLAAGEYLVIVDSRNTFSIEFCTDPSSVKEQSNEYEVAIFPNPNSGNFRVENWDFTPEKFEIFGLPGQVIKKGDFPKTGEFSIPDIPDGTYFIKLISKEATLTQKFILKN